ncbi:unnamed protein product [Mytilus edulis]|uniref:Sushi, nidogen and EGF-like domain-containing protein 1 n=1 Tax=Mytilus edulis TaxID=6550 RepID=A0A8S3SCL0_MYTED|nr:unnamed protein product [Mytilus edulis]
MRTYTPSPFPLESKRRLIAPYWADIDTRNGGIVWYRETTNITLLQKASDEIQAIFAEHYNFHAAWMFIATWDNVAFYGADDIGKQKRCTFQSVLVTNGRHSFTIFLYKKIEWTTGTASFGNSSTGLGNSGTGTLTITPREATMFGGTQLIISGPCFNKTLSMTLVMSNGEEVPCQKYNEFSVSCISPEVYRTGKEMVSLHLIQGNNQTMIFSGVLTIGKNIIIFITTNLVQSTTSSNTNSKIKLRHHSSISLMDTGDLASGMYSFKLNFSKDAGIVKLSTNNMNSPYYWSDMFTVYVGIEESQALCYKMLDDDNQLPAITTDDVQPCPCTLEVASLDTTRFSIDPLCHNQEGSRYECSNQQFAQVCFKQNIASSQGYDHQCCYNDEGVLMNPDGYYGSGYVNRYHFHGDGNKNVPFLSNFVYDTLLYQHCCIYTSQDLMEVNSNFGSCASFYTIRPPNSCLNYIPPRPASSVTSFVVRPYPEAEIIEVQVNQIRGIDVLVNGTLLDFDLAISKVISVEGATIEKISENPPTVVTNFYTEGLSIQSSSNLNVLNLLILTSPDRQTGRIKESESLFTYEGGKTYASYQNENFIPNFEIPENISTIVICGFPPNTSNGAWYANNGYTEGSLASLNCTNGYYPVDVNLKCLSSGNWSSVNISCIPFPDCGRPSPVANGLWVPNEGSNGRRATLRCKNGFNGDEIEISCTDNGTWTEYEGSCLAAQTLSSTSDSNSKMSTASVKITSSNLEDTTKPKTSDEIVQSSSNVYTSIRTTRQASTVVPTTQRFSRQTLSSTQSSTSVSSTSDSNSKMSTASITMTSSNLEDTTKTKTSDEIVQSSSKVYTSIRTTRPSSTAMPTTQRSSQQTLSSTTQSAQTTRPRTSTPTTAAKTSTSHNQQEISQTSESSLLQTSSNIPHSQFVSVKSTSSNDIKSTQDNIVDNAHTSEAIDGSTTRKSSSTLKSSDTNESTGTSNFTIAISVTISVVCLAIVVTVVAVAMVKISKQRKGGLNRYEVRKSYEEDRSSTNSDPSSLYKFQIKRPLFGQEWSHQQPIHSH